MNLHYLFNLMAASKTEAELRFRLMDHFANIFSVQRWGIYLFDIDNRLVSSDAHGVRDKFITRYQKIGKSVDPVLKYVAEYHAPAHEELVLSAGTWKQSQLYQRCCIEYDHEHVMTRPIIGNGKLVGTINFARVGITPAFNTRDLSNLSAVCLHFSACLANLRSAPKLKEDSSLKLLTPREIQIARLVSQGLTNDEIGRELWIGTNTIKKNLKQMFRKLAVTSRLEMAMLLLQRLKML